MCVQASLPPEAEAAGECFKASSGFFRKAGALWWQPHYIQLQGPCLPGKFIV